ncbi:MAG: phosphoribosylformylglycinamidine cyclo-ligase [Rhodothermaceae bacterium]|nr:phosphoribosylformylglycinamidine cyclo-ligase [Rhodothermaceae bacterium]
MITYRDAGVDIEAGDEVVKRIKPLVRETFTPQVLTDIGAFGGFFQFNGEGYDDPVLVSSVDGVGTKLKVAFKMNRHDTVGQDLVNHCVNDIAVCGAKPLFFLDYFSTGKLSKETAVSVVSGFAKACKENGCALIGGETAEMPDIYSQGEYDLAGTIVGIVDRAKILSSDAVGKGDVLIGLPSTGLHTNGYSLARKVLFTYYSAHDTPERLGGESVGQVLLKIHRSYLGSIQLMHEQNLLHAAAHITGGGIPGNVQRVIPDGLTFDVDYDKWERPEVFNMIKDLGNVPEEDMRSAFNLGIGLVMIVAEQDNEKAQSVLQAHGEQPIVIGRVK